MDTAIENHWFVFKAIIYDEDKVRCKTKLATRGIYILLDFCELFS